MRLIDADALRQDWLENGENEYVYDTNAVLDSIDEQPTVDAVEVVRGRWLKTCLPDIYQCTNCKRATKMDELCDSEILRAYCPNCGAKMRGDENA